MSVSTAALMLVAGQGAALAQDLNLNGANVTLPDGVSFGNSAFFTGADNVLNTDAKAGKVTEGGGPAGTTWTGAIQQTNGTIAWVHTGGDLEIKGASNNTGGTELQGGTIKVSGTGNLGADTNTLKISGADVTIDGSATVKVGGLTITTGSLTNNGTFSDDLNNGGTVTNTGTMNAVVATNTGTINNNAGTWTGDVLSNTGTIENKNGAKWVGDASNDGTVKNDGTWTGKISNSGTFNNTGNGTVSGLVTNLNGTTTNDGTLASVLNSGGTTDNNKTITGNASVSGGTLNNKSGGTIGTVDVSGGAFNNKSGGSVTGATTISGGTITNDGTLASLDQSGGTVDNNNKITGKVDVSGGTFKNNASGSVDGVTTNNGGTITNAGTLSDLVNKSGTVTSTNKIAGTVSNSDILKAQGTIGGDVTNKTGGKFTVTGDLDNSGKNVDNQTGATLTVDPGFKYTNIGTLTNTGQVTNNGTIQVNTELKNNAGGVLDTKTASSVIDGKLTNAGTVNAAGNIKNGNVTNLDKGQFTAVGDLSNNGKDFDNQKGGTLTVNTGVSYTSIGKLNNDGTVSNSGTIKADSAVSSLTFGNTGKAALLETVKDVQITGGTFTNEGTVKAGTGVVVSNGATLDTKTKDSVIDGKLTNAGTVNAAGNIKNGDVTNQDKGKFTAVGDLSNNGKDFDNQKGGTLTVNTGVSYTSIGKLNNDGTVSNSGTIKADSAVSSLTFGNTGKAALLETVKDVQITGGTFTNEGTVKAGTGVTVSAGATLDTKTKDSVIDGKLTNNGGTVNAMGNIKNGDVTNTGATAKFNVLGDLSNNKGNFDNLAGAKVVVGDGVNSITYQDIKTLKNDASVIDILSKGTVVASVINNLNKGTINVGDNATLKGTSASINNSATINVANAGTIVDATDINNNAGGVINFNGTTGFMTSPANTNAAGATIAVVNPNGLVTITGPLTNDGLLTMQNNSVANTVTVTGDYKGGGTLKQDVNLTGVGSGDLLAIQGKANGPGTTAVSFNVLQAGGFLNKSGNGFLDVVTTGGTNGTAFSGATAFNGAPVLKVGFIDYTFQKNTTPGFENNYAIKSSYNSNLSPLASLAGAGAIIAGTFHQPASSYVAAKANPRENEFGCGVWGRGDGARYKNSSTTTFTGNSALPASTNVTQFSGIQSGIDCAIMNIDRTGWNAHLGFTAGYVSGRISDQGGSGGRTDLESTSLGMYAFFTNAGFTLDLSVRRDLDSLKFGSNFFRVDDTVNGNGVGVSGYTSYRIQVANNTFLTPYGGLNWNSNSVSSFLIANGTAAGSPTANVDMGTNNSLIGRMGLQASYVMPLSNSTFLTPFASASWWRNFENTTSMNVVMNGATNTATTIGSRDFGQYDIGLSLADTVLNAGVFVKGTLRDGDTQGTAWSVGGRVNF